MNTRDYKQFAPGEIYHVYNRGNGRMDIFRDGKDYLLFLSRLREYLFPNTKEQRGEWCPSALSADGAHLQTQSGRYKRKALPSGAFTLLCYCLMPNHFHLLIKQNTDLPISTLLLRLCGGYAKCFNDKYSHVGTIYQDQFKAKHVDDDQYLKWLSAYIHINPVVAEIVTTPEQYAYSSYPDYVAVRQGTLCDKHLILDSFKNSDEYKHFVEESIDIVNTREEILDYCIDGSG